MTSVTAPLISLQVRDKMKSLSQAPDKHPRHDM